LNLSGVTIKDARDRLASLEKKILLDARLLGPIRERDIVESRIRLGQRRTNELQREIEASIAAKKTEK
jgi:hypothetical protein